MTAEEIDYFVFYSVHKYLFEQNCTFFSVKIYLKLINKCVLGCPRVSSGVLWCPPVSRSWAALHKTKMSAPFQKMLCQIIKKQVLKNQCSVNKSCQRQLSFASFSFNTGSFNYMKTRYVKVVASIIGVSSVFVTKALWNSTAAKTSAPNQATSQNVHIL